MIYHILTFYSDAFAPLFPLLVLWAKRKVVFEGRGSVILFLITAALGFGLADCLGDTTGNNLYVYNLLPVTFSLVLHFFFRAIFKNTLRKKLSLCVFIITLIFYITGYRTIIDSAVFNSNFYIVFSISVCVNCFLFYFEELLNVGSIPIWKTNHFWFVTCLLFYAAASTFIWLFFRPLMDKAISVNLSYKEMKYIGDLWKLHNLFFCISCVTLSIAILWKK